jgi:transposase
MGLPPSPFSKGVAPYGRGYHNEQCGLLPSSETTVEETQEVPVQKEDKEQARRQTQSFRQSGRQCPNRYVLWTGCQWKALHRDWFGVSSSVVHERFQRWRQMSLFEMLMRRGWPSTKQGSVAGSAGDGRRWTQSTVRLFWEATKRATIPPIGASCERRSTSWWTGVALPSRSCSPEPTATTQGLSYGPHSLGGSQASDAKRTAPVR